MTNVEIRKERTSMELLERVLDDKNLFNMVATCINSWTFSP